MAMIEAIREALHAEPFRPFDLKLVDGRHFTITHPEFIAFPPLQRLRDIVLFTTDADMEPGAYRSRRIDLGLIAQVTNPSEVPPPPQAER
jgi:hypothetical protein